MKVKKRITLAQTFANSLKGRATYRGSKRSKAVLVVKKGEGKWL